MKTSSDARKTIKTYLAKDKHLFIHANTQHPELIIPEYLKKDLHVTLKLSYYFETSVEVLKEKILATLLFSKNERFDCVIPIQSIFACTTENNEHYLFEQEKDKVKKETKQNAALSKEDLRKNLKLVK